MIMRPHPGRIWNGREPGRLKAGGGSGRQSVLRDDRGCKDGEPSDVAIIGKILRNGYRMKGVRWVAYPDVIYVASTFKLSPAIVVDASPDSCSRDASGANLIRSSNARAVRSKDIVHASDTVGCAEQKHHYACHRKPAGYLALIQAQDGYEDDNEDWKKISLEQASLGG